MKIMLHGLNETTFHVTQGVGSSHDGPAWDPGHPGPSGLVSSCVWNFPSLPGREVLPAASSVLGSVFCRLAFLCS